MWYEFSLQLACLKRHKVQRTIIKSGSFETYSCETVKDVSTSWHWQINRSNVNPSGSHASSMLLAGCRQCEGVTLMIEWNLSLCITTEITGTVCPGISAFSSFVRGESFSFKWRHFISSVCTLTCFIRVQLFATPKIEPTGLFAPEILQLRALEWIAPSSRGSSRRRDQMHTSWGPCIGGRSFTTESPGKPFTPCTSIMSQPCIRRLHFAPQN